ncbi:PH domain-containing protein [Lysinibacillus agricola]|uniref:PH domain-containing protein n=1 Tax=Lysinibacillus agricola TaxID=2590012 RepID=A0ABX7AM79_9BACI|nr:MULTISPECIES: PH domain-containing protein [Lysinibacillus]QQP10571.1 PH domain-containing protein [Lysinibacillus agricola]
MMDFYIISSIFLVLIIFLFWIAIDIVYRFEEEHLYLRAGCLFTRIKYIDISSYRELNGLMDILTGFNLLSSSKGIAILSDKVMLGEVKISPVDQEGFIRELERRIK